MRTLGLTAALAGVWLTTFAAMRLMHADPDVSAALKDAKTQGQIVRLEGVNFDAIPTLPVDIKDAGGPQFLFSDKPEYFRTGDGIAMQEAVKPGVVRLYLYHVPTPKAEPKTITAVIDNLGDREMTVTFRKEILPKAGGDYHLIGKTGLLGYLADANADAPARAVRVAPGAIASLDPRLDEQTVTTDQLVHGFYEFTVDQPARVSVFQRDPKVANADALKTLPKLPRVAPGTNPSGAGRGLFLTSDRDVSPKDGRVFDTAGGASQVILADGKSDPWIRGRDSIDGLADGENKGNYGVLYRVRIPYTSTDGRGVAVVVYNARSTGKWCGKMAGAVRVGAGDWPAGVVGYPSTEVRVGGPPDAVIVQRYPAVPAGREGTIELTFSPPGASCLPVPIVLLPY